MNNLSNILLTVLVVYLFSFNIFGSNLDKIKQPGEVIDTTVAENWKLGALFSLNMTQSTFTNWAAGGQNNISGIGMINGQATYNKDRVKWANTLNLGLGGIQNFGDDLLKTDDIIDMQSTFSYGVKKPWYIALLGGFRTQFLDGFANPTDTVRASTFMAPGYVNTSLGIEYVKSDNFKIMASPLSGKFTFVRDQTLADEGAFGVTPGENFRPEIGSYIRIMYNKELMENITLKTRWEFFSNYIENPQNIDINGELMLAFKVNKLFSATIQANLIYDDDIKITDRFGNVGPRTQFKQVIGVGLSYRIANFKE